MLEYDKRRQIERRMKILRALAVEVEKRDTNEPFSPVFIEACVMYINGTEKPRISIRAGSRVIEPLVAEPCIVRNIRPEKTLVLIENTTFLQQLELQLGRKPTQEEALKASENEILLQRKSLPLAV